MAVKKANEFVDGLDNLGLQKYLWEHCQSLSTSELLVALNLAKHRNRVTLKCCPSEKRIAEQTRLHKRTVSRAIKKLEKEGVVCVKRNCSPRVVGERRERLTNSYLFTYDANDLWEIIYHDRQCPDLDADAVELLEKLMAGRN